MAFDLADLFENALEFLEGAARVWPLMVSRFVVERQVRCRNEISGARVPRKMALVRPTLTDQKVGTGTVRSLMSA
jgi:hypothetical protein